MEQYRSLGFTVIFGGVNGPTHNALIGFRDGTYIELISMRSAANMAIFRFLYRTKLLYFFKPFVSLLSWRFFCWMGGPTGIRDWCIRQAPLEHIVSAFESNNLGVSKIKSFTRVKPNAEVVEWRLAAPENLRMPFFIDDVSGIEARMPAAEGTNHKNRYTGISTVLLADKFYAGVKSQFSIFGIAETGLVDDPSQGKIRFVDAQGPEISIELVGAQASNGILRMLENQAPEIAIST
jgi:hypothetical protein